MAAAAPIALGLQLAGQIGGGIAENNAARANAERLDEDARRGVLAGELETEAARRRERALSGDAIAAQGANGTEVGTGSALDLLRQNAVNREYDVLAARYEAGSRAAALRDQAKQQRRAGKQALIGAVLGAGAKALMGAAPDASRPGMTLGGLKMPLPQSRGSDIWVNPKYRGG